MITKLIDNFSGILTRQNIGDMNSGLAKYATTFGNDPISDPSNLTWLEMATQIDPTGSVITDLIVCAQPRLESGITYVYAVGHTGQLYKIQVNQPSGYNPNLDTPVLLTTLTVNSPTFKYGASIQFYGPTEKIYIGHDLGVTSISFAGANETFVGALSSWTANVPRPSVNFLGKLEFGNGNNLAEIDSTETVTTYAKLSPAFPTGMYIRDLDLTPNGTYLQGIVSYLNAPDMTSATQDTTSLSSTNSYLFQWNGTDMGYTTLTGYGGFSMNSNISFGPFNYQLGYDLGGAALYSGGKKILSLPNSLSPNFEAMFSTGNMLGIGAPETVSGFLKAYIMFVGQYDLEMPKGGWYRYLRMNATSPETDIIQMPVCLTVSNLFYGSSSSGYANNQVGSAKVYFSTLETSSAPTTQYRFYKFTTIPTGIGTTINGVYETQQETSIKLFRNILKEKLKVSEIRVYVPPLVVNNSFQIDLIGPGGIIIPNSSETFTVGTNCNVNDVRVKYNPTINPQYSIGVRITNLGSKNWTLEKMELDVDEVGN